MTEKVTVKSQGIHWVAYDEKAKTLDVEFASSQAYRYFDVPREVYEWLLRAGSKGKFINRLVKDRYRYETIGSAGDGEAPDLMGLLERSLHDPD